MNIIMGIIFISVVILMYFVMKNEAKFKKNIVIGATLPYTAKEDPEVTGLLSAYKKELTIVCTALILITAPLFFLEDEMLLMTFWLTWTVLVLVLTSVVFIRYNLKLRELKRKRGWVREDANVVTVRTEAIPQGNWVSPWAFAPAVIMCIVPAFYSKQFWPISISTAVFAILCWFGYRYAYRNKAETVDENIAVTKALTQIRRHAWAKMWIHCAYYMACVANLIAISLMSATVAIVLGAVLTILLMYIAIRLEFKTRKLQETLTKDSGKTWYVDDDDKWLGGMFYHNPDDDKLIVNNRTGLNTTVNLAKPAGKVIMGLVALMLLAMPFMGAIIDGAIGKPITMTVYEGESSIEVTDINKFVSDFESGSFGDEAAIEAIQGKKGYKIDASEIAEIKVLEKLPKGLTRAWGTGASHLLKGKFTSEEYGMLNLCLDPQCGPFVLITTNDGEHYLFGIRV